jgi:peptidoglycan hydrolase-like protein with peptidoglycan-binding domain
MAARSSIASRAATLRSLQRGIGNAAVAGVLTSQAGGVLARYEAGEHVVMGSPGKTLKIGGVEITEAELTAMGDFYGDPDKMSADATANRAKFQKLLDDIRADRALRLAGKEGIKDEVWDADTAHRPKGETYTDLAGANFAHFAPGKVAGPNFKDSWESLHRRALDLAHAAASGSKEVPDEARVINGFAAHFLTDAFSAGHLANKKELMDAAQAKFDALPTTGMIWKENSFSKAVAKGMLADATISTELAKWELDLGTGYKPFAQENTSELIYGLRKKEPQLYFSLFARTVHDDLDAAIRGGAAKGLEVTNDNGDVWTLSGDETLSLSPTTQSIAAKAVEAARDNLSAAASTPGPLDYAALFKKVWRFTPRPTTDAEHTAAVAAKAASLKPKPPDPPGLKSKRWGDPPNKTLQDCFDDKARLRPRDPDTDAVTKLQQALVDVEKITGNHYDLGPRGVDGDYGGATARAVQKFKKDQKLGSEQYSDVGPGTMAELDRLFMGAAPKPPPGPALEPGDRAGAGRLQDAITTYTDPGNSKTVDAIVQLAGKKLGFLLATLQAKGYARPKKK